MYIVIYLHAGKLVDIAVSPRTPLCIFDNDTSYSRQMNPISKMLSLLDSAYDFSDTWVHWARTAVQCRICKLMHSGLVVHNC